MQRHPMRRALAASMRRQSHLAPGRVVVGDMLHLLAAHAGTSGEQGPPGASEDGAPTLDLAYEYSRNATFCLCPSGDTPGFTQRFYQSILAGCIPILVDLYLRYPPDHGSSGAGRDGRSFPFPSLICWPRFVIELPLNRSRVLQTAGLLSSTSSGVAEAEKLLSTKTGRSSASEGLWAALEAEFEQLVPSLLRIERRAAEAARYMMSISHLLRFDAHLDSGELPLPDAASAALQELAIRLGRGQDMGQGGGTPCDGQRPLLQSLYDR